MEKAPYMDLEPCLREGETIAAHKSAAARNIGKLIRLGVMQEKPQQRVCVEGIEKSLAELIAFDMRNEFYEIGTAYLRMVQDPSDEHNRKLIGNLELSEANELSHLLQMYLAKAVEENAQSAIMAAYFAINDCGKKGVLDKDIIEFSSRIVEAYPEGKEGIESLFRQYGISSD